jgi:hypothetical protein
LPVYFRQILNIGSWIPEKYVTGFLMGRSYDWLQEFITVDLYEKRLLEDEILRLQSNFETPHL